MIKVLITDDHPVVRRGLMQLLEDDKDERFGALMEAGNGKEMFDILGENDFDVVLLDISLPGRNGLELLKELRVLRPKIPVLMLSIYPEEHYALQSLKLGASGYITKNSPPDELINAICRVATGGRYITPALAEKIADNYLSDKDIHYAELLSPREMEVITLLASGKTLSGIAEELSLSPKTISTYRERILLKLNLKTTSEIIRYAFKEGLTNEQ
jgi:two-component system, NarL family, invasion response regulator UvrY